MTEIGTLKELDVKPGDMVECVWGSVHAEVGEKLTINENCDIKDYENGETNHSKFRIISRATPAPKLWRDMTPEEKGALLLAAHEGKVIEWVDIDPEWQAFKDNKWRVCAAVGKYGRYAYRVKTEPKVETVEVFGASKKAMNAKLGFSEYNLDQDTHRITFNLIDGKPDCDSVKMEKL